MSFASLSMIAFAARIANTFRYCFKIGFKSDTSNLQEIFLTPLEVLESPKIIWFFPLCKWIKPIFLDNLAVI